jgi:hypothetical protein
MSTRRLRRIRNARSRHRARGLRIIAATRKATAEVLAGRMSSAECRRVVAEAVAAEMLLLVSRKLARKARRALVKEMRRFPVGRASDDQPDACFRFHSGGLVGAGPVGLVGERSDGYMMPACTSAAQAEALASRLHRADVQRSSWEIDAQVGDRRHRVSPEGMVP